MLSAKLLMIRPEKQARSFVSDLSQVIGHEIDAIYDPLIIIQPTGQQIDLSDVTGLIFTSTNAVEIFLAHSKNRDLPAFCVGDTTSNAAVAAGLKTHNAGGTAADLLALIQRTSKTNGSLLYLRGEPSAFDLTAALTQSGYPTRETVLYRQESTEFSKETLAALRSEPVILPVFSGNGFAALQSAVDFTFVENVILVAISPKIVPESFRYPKVQTSVAPEPTRHSMIETIANMA